MQPTLLTVFGIGFTGPNQGRDGAKLSMNGAAKGNPRVAGVGGLILDDQGNWICGFVNNVGCLQSLWSYGGGIRS